MTIAVFHNCREEVPDDIVPTDDSIVIRSNSVTTTLSHFDNQAGHNWLVVGRDDIHPALREGILSYRGELYDVYDRCWMIYQIFSEEEMYLKLMRSVLERGTERPDRTNVGTRAMFGKRLEFSLQNNRLPVMTTKRVFLKGVVKELLWFLGGATNASSLRDDGVHIWDGNSTRAYLDSRGLDSYEEGELGPVYGYQWRNWGKPYTKNGTDRSTGVDQVENIIRTIRENPFDRRMVMSAWNVSDIPKMALPPCHIFAQFYVENDCVTNTMRLSCSMYQRSADLFLGVPFNITSYALLTHMIAHVTGCVADKLIMNFGDAHIYNNHIEQVKTQLDRPGFKFPKITIDCDTEDIDDIKYEHFKVDGYECHPGIKAPMAV